MVLHSVSIVDHPNSNNATVSDSKGVWCVDPH
jgi:hypothetical protein